ncbi:MAG: TonB-dependent receptor, partial [Gammaproteobacteria bacterium]|nr:TonB-dependent receptor [Gammaproteobacteria bacterium]
GGAGDFTTQLNWSHVNNYVFNANDGLGFLSEIFAPEDRLQWNLNWSLSDYSATLIGNYVSDYETTILGSVTIDASTTWDLQLNWATPWNGRLTVGARNLFDKDPPINTQLGSPFYSNQLHDIYGRVPYVRYTQDL